MLLLSVVPEALKRLATLVGFGLQGAGQGAGIHRQFAVLAQSDADGLQRRLAGNRRERLRELVLNLGQRRVAEQGRMVPATPAVVSVGGVNLFWVVTKS